MNFGQMLSSVEVQIPMRARLAIEKLSGTF